MNAFLVKWAVSDGYINHGPQTTKIHVSEVEDCDTEAEAIAMIEEVVQADFLEKVSPAIADREAIAKQVAEIFKGKERP